MAATKSKNKAGRTLITFVVLILALAGTLVGSTLFSDGSYVPKLAIDLEGGTQLILTPKATDGSKATVSSADIDQAIEVIRQRVDASGVAEAEIARNGSENISVGLPGVPSEETLNLVRSSAVMRFRTVLLSGAGRATSNTDPAQVLAKLTGNSSASTSTSTDVTPQATPTAQTPDATIAPTETGATQARRTATDPNASDTAATPEATPSATDKVTPTPAPTAATSAAIPFDQLMKEAQKYPDTPAGNASTINDPKRITVRDMFIFEHLDCSDPASLKGGSQYDDPEKNLVTCDKNGYQKYILGPQVLSGTDVKSASSGMGRTQQGNANGQWEVALRLNSEGSKKFDEVAKVLYPNHIQGSNAARDNNRFAIVLDSLVVSAPGINAPSFNGSASISGSLTRDSAATLANQLQFGSLPLNFEVQSEQRISATLGSEHLKVGFYAALVGLVLVVLYLLWQYHALASVATASLIFAGVLTYLVVAILSWSMGYRLSLAGVVGLIVAVGVTMDSFIIYFERIRDEVRDGKPLGTAVETGWARAKRTIVVSDVVNLVAAVVLYVLAVGGVQGFAFTLGLTTVMDLAIIFLFTHPMMSLLVKTRYFGEGRKFSGLDPEHLGATGGRTYVHTVSRSSSAKKQRVGKVAAPEVSLARAKAAHEAEAAEGSVAVETKTEAETETQAKTEVTASTEESRPTNEKTEPAASRGEETATEDETPKDAASTREGDAK